MKHDNTRLLPRSEILRLQLQRALAHVLNVVLCAVSLIWLRVIMKYRIENIDDVRKKYQTLLGKPHRATLICPNHLTLVDSHILHWAFASWWQYLKDFSLFSWNIPEKRNFFDTLSKKVYCYIGKCIPVVRQAPKEETQRTLNKLAYLLSKGDCATVFPEGTRSRSGKVDTDNFTYGIGTIIQTIPDANVVCAYLRGRDQTTYSDCPKKGERFYVDLELIKPQTEFKGLRGARDLSTQIIQRLSTMERKYFGLTHQTHGTQAHNYETSYATDALSV